MFPGEMSYYESLNYPVMKWCWLGRCVMAWNSIVSRDKQWRFFCVLCMTIYTYILIKLRSNAIIKLIIFLSVTVFSLRFVSSSVACLFQRCTIFNCVCMRSQQPPHFPSPPALLHFIHTHMPTIKHRLLLLRNVGQILLW